MRAAWRRAAAPLALATAALSGCVTPPPRTDATAECRAFFERLDARVARAGLRDGGATRVPGYPYLRSDRFLADFADEVGDAGVFAAWVQALREHDLDSRAAELRNLGLADTDALQQQVQRCGERLAALELADSPAQARLRARVRVQDDYALFPRGLGFYPFAVPFLNRGIGAYHADVRTDYARPLDRLDHPGTLQVWAPWPAAAAAGPARLVAAAPRDALGRPQLDAAQWRTLVQHHAPLWWVEHGGSFDLPGMPGHGAGGRPGVDPRQPVVHYQTGFTRLGTQVLPTLVYTIWFDARPPQGRWDPYAGALDGVHWRVVLDPRGEPLHYDTIHACGCYRYSFPRHDLERVRRDGFWQEPVLFPQDAVPTGRIALRIQSQTHYLRRVVDADRVDGARRTYILRPYSELLTLPDGSDGTRSLFRPDGIVDGSERGERWWLWITGVSDPGAMRQWGRHATSFVGRSHFDDARFLEQNFLIPGWAR